jgi:hypothetical protein
LSRQTDASLQRISVSEKLGLARSSQYLKVSS